MSARAKTPTSRGTPPAPEQQPSRRLNTGGFRPMRPSQEGLKTEIFDTEGFAQGKPSVPQDSIAAPIDKSVSLVVHSRMNEDLNSDSFVKEVATPIKAISMKTPAVERPALDPSLDQRPQPRVKLRAMSELGLNQKQQDLGRLAPPRDPNAAAARRRQDYLVWGSVSVIVASVVALIIWFLAK